MAYNTRLKEAIEFLLKAAISYDHPRRKRRANVMFYEKGSWRIKHYYGFAPDSDEIKKLKMTLDEGCTGMAYSQNCQVFGTREFGVSKKNIKYIASDLMYILSTPVRNPMNPKEVICILNLDSSSPADFKYFRQRQFSGEMRILADIIGLYIYLNGR